MGRIYWAAKKGQSKGITLPKSDTEKNGWEVKEDYHINFDAGYTVDPAGNKKPGISHIALMDLIPFLGDLVKNGKLSGGQKRIVDLGLKALEGFK